MDRRRALAGLALGGGALAVGLALFWPASDEERIRALLAELCASVSFATPIENPLLHGSRLAGRFDELLTEEVDVSIPELAGALPSRRRELALAAAQLATRYGSLEVALGELEVRVAEQATARGSVTVTAMDGSGLRRDARTVVFTLTRESGDWRVEEVRVGSAP
jgi:hypothetical protein